MQVCGGARRDHPDDRSPGFAARPVIGPGDMALKRFICALVVALTFAGPALAAPRPPESVREAVQARIDAVMAPGPDDEDDGGEPYNPPAAIAGPKMFARVNINDDGVADWRVDYEQAPNPSYFCGTGGCRQQIFVSNARGGFDLAMDAQVRLFKLRHSRGQTLLDVDFHGSVCGGFGVDACPRGYVWSVADARFIARVDPGAQTFFIGGPVGLTPPSRATLPAAVEAAFAERAARCAAAGRDYPYDEAYLTEVSDLNADGRADWVIGGTYDGCAYREQAADAPRFDLTVLVSGPDGYQSALRSDVTTWGLDMAGGKTRFVTLEGDDCGLNGKGCPKTYWRWDGQGLVRQPVP